MSTRKRALQVLTANCRCQEDKAALNKLTDTTLISLAENALFKKGNKGGKREDDDEEDEDDEDEEVVDNGDDPFDAGGVGDGGHVPFNPGQMGDRAGKKPAANKKPTDNIIYGDDCEGEDNDDPECRAMFAKKGTANVKKPTFNQLLAAADPETRESIQQGQLALRRQKDRIVRGLVGNVVDDKSRQAMYKKYMQKSLPELNELLLIRGPQGVPTHNRSEQEEPIFIGAGADADVVFNDAGDGDETGILPLPVQNYSNP